MGAELDATLPPRGRRELRVRAAGRRPLQQRDDQDRRSSYPDGSPRVVDTQGSLGFRFTNLDTGASIRRDTLGTLRATIHEDGSIAFHFQGNGLAVIRSTNTIYQPGVYVVSGSADYARYADGQREFTEVDGMLEDVCQTLR